MKAQHVWRVGLVCVGVGVMAWRAWWVLRHATEMDDAMAEAGSQQLMHPDASGSAPVPGPEGMVVYSPRGAALTQEDRLRLLHAAEARKPRVRDGVVRPVQPAEPDGASGHGEGGKETGPGKG